MVCSENCSRDDDDDSRGDGGGRSGDFRGGNLSNATHMSATDPDARLIGITRHQR